MASWKDVLGVAAPAIATALGGPLAGMATTALCGFFGLGSDASEADIAKAIAGMSPEQAIALKKIDLEFSAKMKELDIELDRIYMQDRDSARKMATVQGIWFQIILTTFCIAVFTTGMLLIIEGHMDDSSEFSKQIITYAMGQVTTWIGVAIAFFFGSSKSSQEKDKTIQTLSK